VVTLPPEFTATMYPGYFWNTDEKRLYSIKVSGELRPLVSQSLSKMMRLLYKHPELKELYNRGCRVFYNVSVKGRRRILTDLYLQTLEPADSVVPVRN